MGALDAAVRQGKALYAGISSYPARQTREAVRILRELGTPALVHQPSYSMLDRWIEPELLGVLREEGLGCVVFSPLAQGLLSGKYLDGVPAGSRASQRGSTLGERQIEETRDTVRTLDAIARRRGQTLAQLALAWVLRDPVVTSALVGVSSVEQLDENLAALDNRAFTAEELAEIEQALA
jgi:L-glyceraldehyde 3-phosphate reductase